MKRLPFDEIVYELTRILTALGFESDRANRCAVIFTENTCDGVVSHGLNRFPRFVQNVKTGIVNIHSKPQRVSSCGVIEQWDGMRGVGPLNAEFAMKRAIELSHGNGLGCVGLRNTNHWMRGGTYGLVAAEAGCIGMCWTNTIANMPPWGSAEKKIGNNPLAICIPNGGQPVLLDMAMSQFSNGTLEVLRRRGEKLPLAGGYNNNGELTTDPDAILDSGRALPIGYWKGSGLAFVLDLLASVIADGDSTREISQRQEETGVSQVFMAINIVSQFGADNINEKINAVINDFAMASSLDGNSKARFPGQGMLAIRRENLQNGIPVESDLWQTIKNL